MCILLACVFSTETHIHQKSPALLVCTNHKVWLDVQGKTAKTAQVVFYSSST